MGTAGPNNPFGYSNTLAPGTMGPNPGGFPVATMPGLATPQAGYGAPAPWQTPATTGAMPWVPSSYYGMQQTQPIATAPMAQPPAQPPVQPQYYQPQAFTPAPYTPAPMAQTVPVQQVPPVPQAMQPQYYQPQPFQPAPQLQPAPPQVTQTTPGFANPPMGPTPAMPVQGGRQIIPQGPPSVQVPEIPPPHVLAPAVYQNGVAPPVLPQVPPGPAYGGTPQNNSQQNNYYNNYYYPGQGMVPYNGASQTVVPPQQQVPPFNQPATGQLPQNPMDQQQPQPGQQPPVPPANNPATNALPKDPNADPNKPPEEPKPPNESTTINDTSGALDGPTIERLNRRLEDPNTSVRSEAAMDLYKILEANPNLAEDPQVGPWIDALLQKVLKDPSPLVRQPALLSMELGFVKNPSNDVRMLLEQISQGSSLYDLEAPIATGILNSLQTPADVEGPIAAAQHNWDPNQPFNQMEPPPVPGALGAGPNGMAGMDPTTLDPNSLPPDLLQALNEAGPQQQPQKKEGMLSKLWPFGKKNQQAPQPAAGPLGGPMGGPMGGNPMNNPMGDLSGLTGGAPGGFNGGPGGGINMTPEMLQQAGFPPEMLNDPATMQALMNPQSLDPQAAAQALQNTDPNMLASMMGIDPGSAQALVSSLTPETMSAILSGDPTAAMQAVQSMDPAALEALAGLGPPPPGGNPFAGSLSGAGGAGGFNPALLGGSAGAGGFGGPGGTGQPSPEEMNAFMEQLGLGNSPATAGLAQSLPVQGTAPGPGGGAGGMDPNALMAMLGGAGGPAPNPAANMMGASPYNQRFQHQPSHPSQALGSRLNVVSQ